MPIKTKWAVLTFRGPCSTALLWFSTKYSESLWQFSTLWEWFSRMRINSRILVEEESTNAITLLLFQRRFIAGPLPTKGKITSGGWGSAEPCSLPLSSSASELWHLASRVKPWRCLSGRRDFHTTAFSYRMPSRESRRYGKSIMRRGPSPPCASEGNPRGTQAWVHSASSAWTRQCWGPSVSYTQQATPPRAQTVHQLAQSGARAVATSRDFDEVPRNIAPL